MKQLFSIFLLVFVTTVVSAQTTDTTAAKPKPEKYKDPRPKKAALLSTAFPGLGQAYNKKYWKMPIIYAAEGALVYSIIWNNIQYNDSRKAYEAAIDTSSKIKLSEYDKNQLKLDRDYYRRNRDLSIFGALLVYGINILDAHVDAHLQGFKISNDLSLKVKPFYYTTNNINFATGLTFNLQFRK